VEIHQDVDDRGFYARGGWGLFSGVDGEGNGSEAVVVGALMMVEEQFPRLGALAMFDICERNP